MTIEQAVALLKENGFIVFPPFEPSETIPDPMPGQVWVSPNPHVTPRTISDSGNPWVVLFSMPNGTSRGISSGGFKAWARKTDARPIQTTVQTALAPVLVHVIGQRDERPGSLLKRLAMRIDRLLG